MNAIEQAVRNVRHPKKEWRARTAWGRFWLAVLYIPQLVLVVCTVAAVALGALLSIPVVVAVIVVIRAVVFVWDNWPSTYKDGTLN